MNVGRKTTLLLKCSLFKGCFVHFRRSIICKARAEMSSFRFTSWSSPEIRPRFQMTSIYKAVCVGGTAKTWETWQQKHSNVTSKQKTATEYAILFWPKNQYFDFFFGSWEEFYCFSGGIRWSNIAVSSMGLFAMQNMPNSTTFQLGKTCSMAKSAF